MKNEDDFGQYLDWTSEGFEEEISATLISLYESKLTGQKHLHPSQRINENDLKRARKFGIYLPNQNRLIIEEKFDTFYSLPKLASISLNTASKKNILPSDMTGYRQNYLIEQVERLPNHQVRTGGGKLFKLLQMVVNANGKIDGQAIHFSVDKDGNIYPCNTFMGNTSQLKSESKLLNNLCATAISALNFEADKSHCWTIDAQEHEARCVVGVDKEQVKSLLYARTLPTTATGRKRPILHLVAAHRRRIKEGIDIEINDFLRGIRTVEMNGTLFTVNTPRILNGREKERKFLESQPHTPGQVSAFARACS